MTLSIHTGQVVTDEFPAATSAPGTEKEMGAHGIETAPGRTITISTLPPFLMYHKKTNALKFLMALRHKTA
jgi:hypothetical protein